MITILKSLSKDRSFIKYFSNTSWLFAEKILRMTVGLFVSIWVARYLGPEQYGLFSYAQSFVSLFTVFATLGLDGIIVRELVSNPKGADEIIGTGFWLKLMGAMIVLVVLGGAVKFTSNDHLTNMMVFIVASATIFQSFNVIDFYFQSLVLSKYVVYANFISLLLSSITKIFLIVTEASLVAFAWVVLFDSIIMAVGLICFYKTKNPHFNAKMLIFNKSIALSLLTDSYPLIFSGAVLMIQARIDQVMLKEISGSIETGYYSVALRFIEVFGFVPMLMKNSLYPAIQNAKNLSRRLYQDRLLNFYRINFIFFLIFALPIYLFSEKIIVTAFGFAYQPAGTLLALMSIRLFFTNMGVARSIYILTENLMMFSLITMIIGTMINIGLNYLWIYQYGAKGAILATIVSFSVTIFFIDIFYSKTRQNSVLQLLAMLTFYKINIKGMR